MSNLPQISPTILKQSYQCILSFAIHLDGQKVLDQNYLRIDEFTGTEQATQLFSYQVTLRADDAALTKKQVALDFSALLGRLATVALELPVTPPDKVVLPPGAPSSTRSVYFNGMISSMGLAQPGVYSVTLRPLLWKLSLSNNYRIFSKSTILGVITTILGEHDVPFDASNVTHMATTRDQDWMQAGETDLEFITNLMTKTGIHYYFQHSAGNHTLVLSDNASYPTIESGKPLFYSFTQVEALNQDNWITSFNLEQTMVPSAVETFVAQPEAAWETTQPELQAFPPTPSSNEPLEGFKDLYVYQYGSSSSEALDLESETTSRMQASAMQFSGSSTSPYLRPGFQFQVQQNGDFYAEKFYSPDDVPSPRPELNNQIFVTTQVQHKASASGEYSNQFQAVPQGFNIAGFNISQTHQGSILGWVVSPPGQSPTSHKFLEKGNFGNVSNQFESDYAAASSRQGVHVELITGKGTTQKAWVQLSDSSQTAPEIGATVIVSRSQDESEIPVIQGIVKELGNKNVVPLDPPLAQAVANTSVGDTYSTSYGDTLSIHYGRTINADLATAKNLVESAYQTGKYNDASYNQASNYSYSIAQNNTSVSQVGTSTDTSKIGTSTSNTTIGTQTSTSKIGTQTSNTTIGESTSTTKIDTQTDTSTIGVSTSKTDIGVQNSNTTIGSSTSVTKIGSQTDTSTIGTSNSTTNIGTQNSTTNIGTQTNKTTVDTSTNTTNITDQTDNTKIKTSNSTSNITTQTSNTTVGTSTNTTKITTQKDHTNIDSSTSYTKMGTQNTETHVGSSTNKTHMGSQNDTTNIGSQDTHMQVGSQSGKNQTGKIDMINMTGMHNSINLLGTSNTLDLTGSTQSISLKGGGLELNMALGSKVEKEQDLKAKMSGMSAEVIDELKVQL